MNIGEYPAIGILLFESLENLLILRDSNFLSPRASKGIFFISLSVLIAVLRTFRVRNTHFHAL